MATETCPCGTVLTIVGYSHGLRVVADPTCPTIDGTPVPVSGGPSRCFRCLYEERKARKVAKARAAHD